jgi:hypothetical protein
MIVLFFIIVFQSFLIRFNWFTGATRYLVLPHRRGKKLQDPVIWDRELK